MLLHAQVAVSGRGKFVDPRIDLERFVYNHIVHFFHICSSKVSCGQFTWSNEQVP